jgi:hypothetical protein
VQVEQQSFEVVAGGCAMRRTFDEGWLHSRKFAARKQEDFRSRQKSLVAGGTKQRYFIYECLPPRSGGI